MITALLAGVRVGIGKGPLAAQLPLFVHVAGGSLAIVTGYLALSVAKGGELHRKSGVLFAYSMLVMGLFGTAVATYEVKISSVTGGLMAAYMAVTALTTVRPRTPTTERIDRIAMFVALATGLTSVGLSMMVALSGARSRDGVPVAVGMVVGAIGIAAGLSDIRVMRRGGLRGAPRIRRHLLRMCYALFIAAGSFFLGQAKFIPKPLRIGPLLSVAAFAPLVAMVYWLWRVRTRGRLRGLILSTERPSPGAQVSA